MQVHIAEDVISSYRARVYRTSQAPNLPELRLRLRELCSQLSLFLFPLFVIADYFFLV